MAATDTTQTTDASGPTPSVAALHAEDRATVRSFLWATLVWGVVASALGALAALQLVFPTLNLGQELAFGRLAPLASTIMILGFGANALFAGTYHATQRLCATRMSSDALSAFHCWGWQLIVLATLITLPLGITQGRAGTEPEWPIDLAITVVWIAGFGLNVIQTARARRERYLHASLFYIIAAVVVVPVVHIMSNLAWPIALWHVATTGQFAPAEVLLTSYPAYAGAQDAFVQVWARHNLTGFLLVIPFIGLLYYFLPKASGHPVRSDRLSIVQFWTLLPLVILAAPVTLYGTPIPDAIVRVGMLVGLVLAVPLGGTIINALAAIRTDWRDTDDRTAIRFFIAGLVFLALYTLHGLLLTVGAINERTLFTNWTAGQDQLLLLGWVPCTTFGVFYWIAPRLFQTDRRAGASLAAIHLWATVAGAGIAALALSVGGIVQAANWRALEPNGILTHPEFVTSVIGQRLFYIASAVGALLSCLAMVVGACNIAIVWSDRPTVYDPEPTGATGSTIPVSDGPTPNSRLSANTGFGHVGDRLLQGHWHRRLERAPVAIVACVLAVVLLLSLLQGLPVLLTPTTPGGTEIAMIPAETPLELMGRDLYRAEGCHTCHTQMVRPIFAETERYGEVSTRSDAAQDRPAHWGTRRIGPDLARESGRRDLLWHYQHLEAPREKTAGSVMPSYKHLARETIDFDQLEARVVVTELMVGSRASANPADAARAQARQIAEAIEARGGPAADEIDTTKMMALLAYVQQLGEVPPPLPVIVGRETTGESPASEGDA